MSGWAGASGGAAIGGGSGGARSTHNTYLLVAASAAAAAVVTVSVIAWAYQRREALRSPSSSDADSIEELEVLPPTTVPSSDHQFCHGHYLLRAAHVARTVTIVSLSYSIAGCQQQRMLRQARTITEYNTQAHLLGGVHSPFAATYLPMLHSSRFIPTPEELLN